jgi:hypothetical protein
VADRTLGATPAERGLVPKRLSNPAAERLRREIRELQRKWTAKLETLAQMNAITCIEPGCRYRKGMAIRSPTTNVANRMPFSIA